jgi:putative drug exporter of the RND superfamily
MLSSYVSQIGFAVAAGVLISMFLSSWLYVPALATLLGRRIWWPAKPAAPTVNVAAPSRALDELQPAGR